MVYPNPTTDFVSITKKSNPIKSTFETSSDQFEVSLFDQRGQEIINRDKADIETTLDLSKLKKGLYYIHIYYKEAVIRKQIKVE
nr:T9SS type A sorting domain-containing protein [Belliella kenyensis]